MIYVRNMREFARVFNIIKLKQVVNEKTFLSGFIDEDKYLLWICA